jgi:hypothetical protein
VTIVMGLDQHRGQVTAEWIETETGEVSRARVAPAHSEPVRRFLGRFKGQELVSPPRNASGPTHAVAAKAAAPPAKAPRSCKASPAADAAGGA